MLSVFIFVVYVIYIDQRKLFSITLPYWYREIGLVLIVVRSPFHVGEHTKGYTEELEKVVK